MLLRLAMHSSEGPLVYALVSDDRGIELRAERAPTTRRLHSLGAPPRKGRAEFVWSGSFASPRILSTIVSTILSTIPSTILAAMLSAILSRNARKLSATSAVGGPAIKRFTLSIGLESIIGSGKHRLLAGAASCRAVTMRSPAALAMGRRHSRLREIRSATFDRTRERPCGIWV